MPVRIYDIAKKLGIETKHVLALAKQLGITTAKVPSSALDKTTADYLEEQLRFGIWKVFRRGLRGMELGNFKAFAETQSIPIRPLTLIVGANSSGKSSVLHGLLLARHAVDTGELDVSRTTIGGDSVDLGGFRQYVHRRETSREVDWCAELGVGVLRGQAGRAMSQRRTLKVRLSFGMPSADTEPSPAWRYKLAIALGRPSLTTYEVEADGEVIIRLSRRPDWTMHVDRLNREVLDAMTRGLLLSQTTAGRVDNEADLAVIKGTAEELVPALRFKVQGVLPEPLLGDSASLQTVPQLVPIGKGDRRSELAGATQLLIPRAIGEMVVGINAVLREQLGRIQYLGPLRSFPPRHLAFSDDRGVNWLAGGGYAWDVVRMNRAVRDAVNQWLGSDRLQTRYQLQIRTLSAIDGLDRSLGDAIEGLPIEVVEEGHAPGRDSAGHEYDGDLPVYGVKDPYAEAAKILKDLLGRVSEKYDELVLMDLRTNTAVTHRDVGIGISQVLPVLVHAYADEGQICAIEQPEIHLHPALQAELGDVFIESALGTRQNTFLLETHSEHLILRILRRVRETTEGKLPAGMPPVRPEDISVVFVEPTSKGSVVRHLPVTPDGDFSVPWPGGFFADRFKDLP